MPDDVLEKLKIVPLEDIHRELWFRGNLSYMLWPGSQLKAYNAAMAWNRANRESRQPYVLCTHRGGGKSFFLATVGVERCIQMPGQNVRFGAPAYKQAVEILSECLPKILEHKPPEIKVYETEGYVKFHNPRWKRPARESVLWKFGANRETIDAQRGLRSNMLLLDEVRNWDDLGYALNDVLYFQTARQANPFVIVASTPPGSVSHYFWSKLVPKAIAHKRYYELTINDNPDMSQTEIDELADSCGGRDTNAWKREALCMRITDDELMVVPEFLRKRDSIVMGWEKPRYCQKFVVGDFGLKDATAILFAYIDYRKAKLVIDNEFVDHFRSTSEIAHEIQARVKELAGSIVTRICWWADAPQQQLYDFATDHKIFFAPPEKYDKWAALAALRGAIQDERIIIAPRCRNLIYQLEAGVFNKRRTDFQRELTSSGQDLTLGHLDAIAALIYLWRMCRNYFHFSPYPDDPIMEKDRHYSVYPESQSAPVRVTYGGIKVEYK